MMSTLPAQLVSGGQDTLMVLPPPKRAATGPFGVRFSGGGGSWASGTSKNTSKKLDGASGGTLNWPIEPKSCRKTPNSCEAIWPWIGGDGASSSVLVHRRWKRMFAVPATGSHSIVVGRSTPEIGRAHV